MTVIPAENPEAPTPAENPDAPPKRSMRSMKRQGVNGKLLPLTSFSDAFTESIYTDCPYCGQEIRSDSIHATEGKCPSCLELLPRNVDALWHHLEDEPPGLPDIPDDEEKRKDALHKLERELAARAVADWMCSEFNRQGGTLVQRIAAEFIRTTFGEDFTYKNDNGNLAIDPVVLREFRRLTEGRVVWEKDFQRWRTRTASDNPHSRVVK